MVRLLRFFISIGIFFTQLTAFYIVLQLMCDISVDTLDDGDDHAGGG